MCPNVSSNAIQTNKRIVSLVKTNSFTLNNANLISIGSSVKWMGVCSIKKVLRAVASDCVNCKPIFHGSHEIINLLWSGNICAAIVPDDVACIVCCSSGGGRLLTIRGMMISSWTAISNMRNHTTLITLWRCPTNNTTLSINIHAIWRSIAGSALLFNHLDNDGKEWGWEALHFGHGLLNKTMSIASDTLS